MDGSFELGIADCGLRIIACNTGKKQPEIVKNPQSAIPIPKSSNSRIFAENSAISRMKKRDKILHEAKTRLVAAFGDRIRDVILFGSRAWGKPHRWSDYDLAVVIRGDYDWRFRHAVSDIMTDIDLDFDVITHPVVVSKQELLHTFRGYEPIFVKALSQGIHA
jgi:predicted nucleotidyltransferase